MRNAVEPLGPEDAAIEDKAKAVLERMIEIADAGTPIGFEEDWGDGTITVTIGEGHTHCMSPDGSVDGLIGSLHDLLVQGCGLSLAGPVGAGDERGIRADRTDAGTGNEAEALRLLRAAVERHLAGDMCDDDLQRALRRSYRG